MDIGRENKYLYRPRAGWGILVGSLACLRAIAMFSFDSVCGHVPCL